MSLKVVALVALASLALADQPQDPQWPLTFAQDFKEISKMVTTNSMTGTMYYDAAHNRERVDRDNGRWDRYCGLNGMKQFQNTPCSQYIVSGDRYLHYPEKNECCYCCSSEHGCGIVKNTWLTGAQYLGQEVHNGVQTYKWNQKGGQDNFYYETVADNPADRVMVALYQEPNDLQDFSTARKLELSDDIFALPSICNKSTTCSFASTCTAVRTAASMTNN